MMISETLLHTTSHVGAGTEPGLVGQGAAGLASGDELEQLLERFLVSVIALAGARAGAVRVLSDDGAHLRLVAQVGLPDAVQASERLVGRHCGVCGVALDSPDLHWLDDPGPCSHANQGATFGPDCARVLAMSLRHGDDVLGIYNLFFDSHATISPETAAVLRLICELLGLAMHNARFERERLRLTVLHERQALVHEVHDAIAQTLVYVKMRLPLLRDAMLAHDDQRSLKYLTDVNQSVTQVHDNLREVMTFFRTRMDPLGLLHAIQGIAAGFHERTGIVLEVDNSAGALHLSDEQEVQVFHIVQEALANIAKHSSASKARLAIRRVADGMEVLIEDDGSGMAGATAGASAPAAGATAHFGMEIMKGRAERLGGSISVGQNDGGGTRVRLLLPTNPSTVAP